jgi:HEAT repeat protein
MKRSKPNIQRLAKMKNVRALMRVLKDSDWATSIRLAAVSALGEMSDLQAIKALIEALKDSDSGIRQAAAATLVQLGDARAVKPLIAAFRDDDWWVRERAAAALVSLGSAALEPLVAALRDNDSGVRIEAAAALERLGWQPVDKTQAALLAVALRADQIQTRQHDARNGCRNAGWLLSCHDPRDHTRHENRAIPLQTGPATVHPQAQW